MQASNTQGAILREQPLPQLTVQQLDYLVAVVDADTWADAAASVGVSPSALSQGIAELERRIGQRLFERQGRRRVLAGSAEPVLRYARDVIARTEDLARWLDATALGTEGRLRLGMIDAAAVGHFPHQLRTFRADRPDLDLRLIVGPSSQLLEQLQRNELDLAVLVRPAVDPSDIDFTPLLEEPLAIYGPPGTEVAGPDTWGPWVTFPASSHTRHRIEAAIRSAGASFDVVAESHQPEVLREMVRLGLGWTVLPVIQGEADPSPLTPLAAEPLLRRHLVIGRRRDALPNPASTALVDDLVLGL